MTAVTEAAIGPTDSGTMVMRAETSVSFMGTFFMLIVAAWTTGFRCTRRAKQVEGMCVGV